MKIRSILLGSAAVLAAGTGSQAADPVGLSFDTCEQLSISGLTISSESDCLQLEGEFSYDWKAANYDLDADEAGDQLAGGNLEWSLKATKTSVSDFGPAVAVLKLNQKEKNTSKSDSSLVNVDELYVGVGDANAIALYGGKKGSIAKFGDDESFTKIFSLNKEDSKTKGLGFGQALTTGGYALQVSHEFGNGLNGNVGLEDLQNGGSAVGAIGVKQDWGTAHATFVFDDVTDGAVNKWGFHAGASVDVDNHKFRAAYMQTEASDSWAALLSAERTFDMFTLAVGLEQRPSNVYEAALSGQAKINDDVTLTLAYRTDDTKDWDIALKGMLKVTDTLTASAKINFGKDNVTALETDLDWEPGEAMKVNLGVDMTSDNKSSFSAKFKKKFN